MGNLLQALEVAAKSAPESPDWSAIRKDSLAFSLPQVIP